MTTIFSLTGDAILEILQYLDADDRIAFTYACKWFRWICQDMGIMSKIDFSKCILRRQQGVIKEFLEDKEMAKYIRELNLNNRRVMNWQMDSNLEDFIIRFCPNLETLHVLNCGLSLQSLHCILQDAHKLTAISWSLMDLTPEDIEFLVQGRESSNAISFENIKNLHLEILESKSYIQILKYLVLARCKYLEELEVCVWQINDTHGLLRNSSDFSFPLPSTSISDTLQHLHSLTILAAGAPPYSCSLRCFVSGVELSEFVFSVVKKKSRETKWKKFWISRPIESRFLKDIFRLTASSSPLSEDSPDELCSVEALAAHAQWTLDVETSFERIKDNTIKSLHLCADRYHPHFQANLIFDFCKPVIRIGGETLKFLSLSFNPVSHFTDTQNNLAFNTLFASCSNITELDLLECHFEKNICEALSHLKRLVRVQVPHCAILSKLSENQVEKPNVNLLTFAENCQHITEFDARGCIFHIKEFSFCNVNSDLLALAKLTKLKSLTLCYISGIEQSTFLKKTSEQCKFLTMLRIVVTEFKRETCFAILEAAKFLKHLAISVSQIDLGSEDFWKSLGNASNLERLCITSYYDGYLNVSAAVEMLKRLPHLHVFHMHFRKVQNLKVFHDQILRALEEEKSDRALYFEFIMHEYGLSEGQSWTSKKVLPSNVAELCYTTPSLALPPL